jgi:hypothetical protein
VASEVCEAAGIPRGERERLNRGLLRREMQYGLRPSRAEVEADDAADAAAMASVPDAEAGSLEGIERDARQRIAELVSEIEANAPEALTDRKVAAAQVNMETELAEAERTLATVAAARRTNERRDVDAAQQAERAEREQADADARGAQPAIRDAAEAVDVAACAFADAVAAFRDLREAQARSVGVAHGDMAARLRRYRPAAVAASLQVALRARGVNVEGIDGHGQDAQPLLAGEPEAI